MRCDSWDNKTRNTMVVGRTGNFIERARGSPCRKSGGAGKHFLKNVLNKTIISKAAQQPKKGINILKNDEQDYCVQQHEPKKLLVNGRKSLINGRKSDRGRRRRSRCCCCCCCWCCWRRSGGDGFWNDLGVTRLRTGEWSRPPAMIQAEGKTAN